MPRTLTIRYGDAELEVSDNWSSAAKTRHGRELFISIDEDYDDRACTVISRADVETLRDYLNAWLVTHDK